MIQRLPLRRLGARGRVVVDTFHHERTYDRGEVAAAIELFGAGETWSQTCHSKEQVCGTICDRVREYLESADEKEPPSLLVHYFVTIHVPRLPGHVAPISPCHLLFCHPLHNDLNLSNCLTNVYFTGGCVCRLHVLGAFLV